MDPTRSCECKTSTCSHSSCSTGPTGRPSSAAESLRGADYGFSVGGARRIRMDEVELGRSGLKVSPICFGTWELGGEWGSFDERAATAAIRRARDEGINFFDTAQGYGFGASEALLGAA